MLGRKKETSSLDTERFSPQWQWGRLKCKLSVFFSRVSRFVSFQHTSEVFQCRRVNIIHSIATLREQMRWPPNLVLESHRKSPNLWYTPCLIALFCIRFHTMACSSYIQEEPFYDIKKVRQCKWHIAAYKHGQSESIYINRILQRHIPKC